MCTSHRVLILIFAIAIIFGPPGWRPSALAQSPQMRDSLRRTSELRRAFRARQRAGARRVDRVIFQMQQQQMLVMPRQLEWQAILLQRMQTTVWNHYVTCGSLNSSYDGGG
jgi:hypothetical protein